MRNVAVAEIQIDTHWHLSIVLAYAHTDCFSGLVHRIVGDEFRAVDIACGVRDCKHNEIGDLLGRAPARIAHAHAGNTEQNIKFAVSLEWQPSLKYSLSYYNWANAPV